MRSGFWAPILLLIGLTWLALRHARGAFGASRTIFQPRASHSLQGAAQKVVSETILTIVVLVGAMSVVHLAGLLLLPVDSPLAPLALFVLVFTLVVEFVLAPSRSGVTPARRVAARLFPLGLACCGFVVLFGG